MEKQIEQADGNFKKKWSKIPIIVRAILIGLSISTIGVLTWSVIATVVPMPWSFIVMIGLLWIYWKYFSGKWWPKNTKEFRKINFRRTKLSTKTWSLAFLAAILIVVIEQSGLVVTFRIIEFPAAQFSAEYSFLERVPLWAAWLVVIMISAVAGICEEVGFRGYMQKPLEKRYGPLAAISIVSVVFVIVHLHQAWSGPILFQIFFISALFGSIAYYSGSLIPGIVAHFIMDICIFSFWWSNLVWQFDKMTIAETGIDLHFIFWSLVFILSLISFVYIMSRLKIQHSNKTAETPAYSV
jgi:membrane protease YdiL (CAAX protease family)